MASNERYLIARKITLIGATSNILLGILKIVFGVLANSQALIADGAHSFSDLLTDAMVIFASKAANRAPDHDHPYGHQRIETLFTIVLALLLISVGLGIAYDAVRHVFIEKATDNPGISTLIIALLSVATNEGLYRYSLKIATKINSNLLIANAWHRRSDAFVSLIVLVGIAGSLIGLHFLDGVAAIIVGALILKMGIKMIWASSRELVDTGLDNDLLQQIIQEIAKVPGVKAVHQLRTRLFGGMVYADVHIQVEGFISVSEGHYISDQVYVALSKNKFAQISDITVHIDPENDEGCNPSLNLPDRATLLNLFAIRWENLPGYSAQNKIVLHYIDSKLYIELFLPRDVLKHASADDINYLYRQAISDLDYLEKLTIYFV